MRFSIVARGALACCFLVPSMAAAQLHFPGMSEYPQNHYVPTVDEILTQIEVEKWREEEQLKNPQLTPKSPAPNSNPLTFVPSKLVRERVFTMQVEAIQKSDPATAAGLAQYFAQNDVVENFKTAASGRGVYPDNIADCMGVYLVYAWRVVHNDDGELRPSLIGDVASQMKKKLAGNTAIAALPNDEKQVAAETLLVSGIMLEARRNMTKADPTKRAALRQEALAQAKSLGFDLTQYALTDDGLVPR